MINPTEDKIQDNIGNLQTEKEKASYSYSEKSLSKDLNKDTVLKKLPSLDKSKSSLKTEAEKTLILDTKNIYYYHYPVQMIKVWKTRN